MSLVEWKTIGILPAINITISITMSLNTSTYFANTLITNTDLGTK